jgi:hypothetical protein
MKRGMVYLAAAVVVMALAFPSTTMAQNIRGEITGSVFDEGGASVPGAVVNATCTTTGLTRSTVSGQSGAYRLTDLPVCIYKIAVTMQGFKTVTREVQAAVGTTTKADIRLVLGQLSEEVTVEGVASVIEFSDLLTNNVDSARIIEMPINGRDFNALLGITPGVQRAPGGGFQSINISGQRYNSNNFMIDGISNNDRYYGGIAMGETGITGTPATIVPPDAIEEFTIQQTPGAEFGVKGGAAINIVLKSGTNQFHGSAHYFRGDDFANAANYFTKSNGPEGCSGSACGNHTALTNQQFGGTFGGPIIKDRTFFFAYYEGQRLNVEVPYSAFVPTPQNISDARARIASAGLTTNAAGENLLKFYPTDPSGEISIAAPNVANSDSFSLKLDHKLNDKNQITLRGMYGQGYQSAPAFVGELVPAAPNPSDMFNSVTSPKVWLVGGTWTSTLSTNKILETRVGYNSFSQVLGINNKIDPNSLGIDTGPLDPLNYGVPYVDYFSTFGYIGGVGGYPITTAPNANLDISSNFSWIKNRHTFKIGANYQHATTYSIRDRARTTLEFTGGTADPVDSIVAMLLGKADFAARSFGSTLRNLRESSIGLYVSDDFKITPRFTLDLALRWDYSTPLGEQNNIGSNFYPDKGLVQLGQGISQLYNGDYNNFGPRVGFSWDLTGDGKTALRGGYALTYDIANFAAIHAPYSINGARAGAFTNPDLGVFSKSLNGGLSVAPDDPAATCVDPVTGVGDYVCITPGQPIFGSNPVGQPPFNIFAVTPNLQTPMFHLFHLSFQREVFKNNVVTLTYLGQRGNDLLQDRDINAPPLGTDYTDPQPSRPFNAQYPQFQHIVELTNDAKSWYDSLQVSWRQNNWHGINTQYNLTWSKCIDYSSANRGGAGSAGQFQNPYDPAGNKGPCDHDVTLNFNVGGVYNIPDFAGKVGQGWVLSTIFTALSGRPYTANVGRDRSGQDFDRVRADCAVGSTVEYNTRNPNDYIANPDIFSVPANGAVGTCGRNSLRGPGLAQWDLALVKNTKVGKDVTVQLRIEGFNLLNRANFGAMTSNIRSGNFGKIQSTPDSDAVNPVISQGGPRAFVFAMKVLF